MNLASSVRVSAAPPARTQRASGLCAHLDVRVAAVPDSLVGLGLFFTPGLAILAYAAVLGKGDVRDGLSRFITQVSAGYFQPNLGGENIPGVDAKVDVLDGSEPLFKPLFNWYLEAGACYKLAFGPKAFLVVSDPVIVRYILRENAFNFDKGVLSEILEPIMGKGLIPADLETWKPRRRAIVPAFHKAYLNAMMRMFGACTMRSIEKLEACLDTGKGSGLLEMRGGKPVLDMETEFLNVALDIIGLGVFNYDFGSCTSESPIIKAVYGVLKEAEHRSTFYIPYWDLPGASVIVPRQRAFRQQMAVISEALDELIELAKESREETDAEALQARDYDNIKDPSLLRFLVDSRGEDISTKQLRDDLMTMLIAGHETTAAVLTWCAFQLAQNPEVEAKLHDEIDRVVGDRVPTMEDVDKMPYLRACLAESLRMYPQPPIMIRRALADDVLPGGLSSDVAPDGFPIAKGADIFISTWNLHRSPKLWKDPDTFRPERFTEKMECPAEWAGRGWEGFDPERTPNALYPNETMADFAFLPFGGGVRKCVGDQFALLEGAVCLSMMARRFKFRLATTPEEVGMATGATIHTGNGLKMMVERRSAAGAEAPAQSPPAVAST
ncbi:unnamed protein product [Pedinophyceae sp. YPF-701]|nr:unnamed protein product [Pedinophyceae sp. YPF-701]